MGRSDTLIVVGLPRVVGGRLLVGRRRAAAVIQRRRAWMRLIS